MTRLPTVGSDLSTWGTVLNAYLAKPWVFNVEDDAYGAVGDGKVITDLVLASNTTATSATANFTSADTGKHIMINGGAGTTSAPLVTTITFVNSTTITLGSAASVTGTGFQAVYGTDDTAAINAAVTAAGSYATGSTGNYYAEVIFGPKIYILGSNATQVGNGTTTPTFNAQIPLPYPNANGTTRKLVIALKGAGDAGFYEYWESTTPNLAGTTLASLPPTAAPSTPSATFGIQSVIGGPSGSAGFTGTFANVKAVIENIQVVCGAYTNQYAYDFGACSAMRVQRSSAHIFAPTGVNGGKSPLLKDLPADTGFQSTIGVGLRAPVVGNNADITADDVTVEGYARGFYVFDHFAAGAIRSIYNDVALRIDLTQGVSGVSHGVFIGLFGCEVYNGGISVVGSSSYCPVYINMDAECTGVSYDVSDSGNNLHGVIHWTDPADSRLPTVTGATSVVIVNDKLGPGVWSGAPSAPSSTAAQTNTAFRPATVYLSATSGITVVKVDSTTTGLVAGNGVTTSVRVPPGHTYTVTYSGTLTTTWILE